VFIVDSPFITPDTAPHFLNRLEPLTLLSALAVSTSKIGLVGTLTTSYWEPYNVARQFGSLDHISKGRAGWNVVTTGLEGAARNYGRDEHFEHGERYERAGEFVDVVQGLWDSYEDDAFPRDKAAGVFLDKTKQHALNHKGKHFSVAGPLALSRSPQGQPVIFQAGVSGAGRDLGAKIAEGVFAGVDTFEDAVEYYADLKARAAALGRDPDHISVLPGIARSSPTPTRRPRPWPPPRSAAARSTSCWSSWAGRSAITTSSSTRWTVRSRTSASSASTATRAMPSASSGSPRPRT
jgi:FMN-dependent oxidoreductase (nitrilotriacetate monooxygenase family)